jgi:hypothetical protein
MASQLIVEIQEDGTIKLNARKMVGSEEQLLEALGSLARSVGGELEVEKHEEGIEHHHHHHGHGGHHHHH